MMGTVMSKNVTLAVLTGILIVSLALFFCACKKREPGQMSARELVRLLDHKDPVYEALRPMNCADLAAIENEKS
jgi:hypothetical protein